MRRAAAVLLLAACGADRAPPPAAHDAAPVAIAADAAPVALAPAPALPCADRDEEDEAAAHDTMTLVPARFDELPAWADDRHAEAIPAFLASCAILDRRDGDEPIGVDGTSGKVRDWRRACRAARALPPGDDAAARAFFEREFRAYAVHGRDGPDGKMTGYYVETLRASRRRHGRYRVPVLGRPADLVSIDLTRFIKDARGRRIWGRHDARTGTIVPYWTRQELRRGAVDTDALAILWADDPVDVTFMEIEGSGRAILDDGGEVWLEFDGKNGRRYRGIGKLLRELGELGPGEGTMPGIRAWFAAHPERVDEILDQNPSKVFFSISKEPGAKGTQGVTLTPRRSLAVDRAFIAFSTPVWVDTRAPVPFTTRVEPWRQLVIAQDTGGGILGAVRGDIYWGADEAAADIGGRMGGPGRYWILLPTGVDAAGR